MSEPQEIKKNPHGGFRPGSGRPKGSGKGTKQGRDAYWAQRVGEIKKRLADSALGEGEKQMTPAQVKAAEVILDRHEPRLASVDQTVRDERDVADPSELAARLAALFHEKPALFEQVKAMCSATNQSVATPAAIEERVTH